MPLSYPSRLRTARWALVLFPALLAAQEPAGELRITVTDSSGAAVAASGLLTSLLSGAVRSFDTDAQGHHTLAPLPFGRYRLQISREGFATHASVVAITAARPLTRAVTLSLGPASFAVAVVGSTPLPGVDQPLDEIPAPIQAATGRDIDASGALDLSDFLNRRMNGVYLNEIQGNPLQPDLNFRGYTASPLLGTPQGVSVYMDGVRLNQPFGDIVSWDLIARMAIAEAALVPGSNPLFGLNTLGGAISLRTKDGASHPGTSLEIRGGSFGRKTGTFEHGGAARNGLHWFLASNFFFEDGWRQASPTNVRQFFGRFGRQGQRTSIGLTLAFANNALIGNGIQEQRLLDRDHASVYTLPDVTAHRAPFVNLQVRHTVSSRLALSGNAYFRHIGTITLNGDSNEESLNQALYQPNAAERAALAAAGYTGFPAAGATAANTPFPFWRCLANVLLRDEPGERCNGLLNRSRSRQRNYGLAGQATWFTAPGGHRNQFTAGAAYDGNRVRFSQSTELGYLNPDRSITPTGAFADGVTGGEIDGEPFDTRVDLAGRIHSASVYATDTWSPGNRWHFTASGRFNRTGIDNRDRIRPIAGTGSLTGRHTFQRFNPAIGATGRLAGPVSLYAGYTEGSRAPTSIELGCADPGAPCRLPNAMAGDPPLEQVITRTLEAGLRSSGEGGFRWSAGWFRAANRNDILFVASQQTGFGYFRNFGRTLRQGAELNAARRFGRVHIGGGYTLLDATFQSPEVVNGSGNSSNQEARAGIPGTEGAIAIAPGNRIPMIPRHMAKAYADIQATARLLVDAGVVAMSDSFARGNENNAHQPDGRYYLGPGVSPGYAVVNLGARYRLHRRAELFAQTNNLFDRRYVSAAQLGATAFTATGTFLARPFPAIQGEFPVQQSTFFAPGAPRGVWAGLRLRF